MLKRSSVDIAKDRLKALVDSDRISCKPDECDKIVSELFRTLSKYIELTPEEFDVNFSRNYIHIKLTGENR